MRLLFDRGTLVLAEAPSECAPGSLPFMLWDEHIGVWRAPGYQYADLRRALDARGLPFRDTTRHTWATPALWRSIDLRRYQSHLSDRAYLLFCD